LTACAIKASNSIANPPKAAAHGFKKTIAKALVFQSTVCIFGHRQSPPDEQATLQSRGCPGAKPAAKLYNLSIRILTN